MDICTSSRVSIWGQGVAGAQTWAGPVVPEGNGGCWQEGHGLCRRSDDGEPAAPGTRVQERWKLEPQVRSREETGPQGGGDRVVTRTASGVPVYQVLPLSFADADNQVT